MSIRMKYFQVFKMDKGDYSIGMCVSSKNWNEFRETYLYINLWKWTISIGRFVA